MPAPKTVADLCREQSVSQPQLVERCGLDEQRVAAILQGRWTPSPDERDAIAAALGVTRQDIVWGHATPIQHIYGSGPA